MAAKSDRSCNTLGKPYESAMPSMSVFPTLWRFTTALKSQQIRSLLFPDCQNAEIWIRRLNVASFLTLFAAVSLLLPASAAPMGVPVAADCRGTSFGYPPLVPLDRLGTGTYVGEQGGL